MSSIYHARRWATENGSSLDLHPGPGFYFSGAGGLSYDGSVVFGGADASLYRWTQATGFQWLQMPSGYDRVGGGGDTSADGRTMIAAFDVWPQSGFVRRDQFIWREGTGFEPIAAPAWATYAVLGSLDGSGTVASGRLESAEPNSVRAARWTTTAGWQVLPLPSDGAYSYGGRISADGRVIVGAYVTSDTSLSRSYYWSEATGTVSIPDVPGMYGTDATAVSGDGSVVVGNGTDGYHHPFIWTAATGTVELAQYLPSIGIDLTDWRLGSAWDISDDGTVIVGTGSHRLANGTWAAESWVVTIPSTPAAGLFSCWAAATVRRRKRSDR